ncbi:SGNH/GDSL hydrolase family protein [Luteolibacter arcticus]|uniref:SGNH/GDSL hydrolase family protein n=1 Tax=Luteolibacter arcticus TaxID=1581411 RepID=A0ABT3GS70_9BACT|nr:SGNH/GDSL hydrolase family protein [Luteolibacter arcticus]MCW1926340.1 SGNH/GDSL hydrolase family protein [Luteolibacter arcticus]
MRIVPLLRRLLPCLVAVSGISLADPIMVGQVLGFTPGIHGAVELVFPSEPAKYYQVQISADMATWDNEGYSVKGTGGQVSVLARTRNLSRAYYRLRDDGDPGNAAPAGPVGPAGSDASVTAANLLAALQAMNAAQESEARAAIQAGGIADSPVHAPPLLGTPHALEKIASGLPLRIAAVGDSMASGLDVGPLMAKRGFIGLTVAESLKTGAVTNVTSDFASWVNGTLQRFAPGSAGEFVPDGLTGANGYTQGNKAAVIYIARPGAGTFRLQSKSLAGVTVVLDPAIDATRDGAGNKVAVPTGVVREYNLPISGYPPFRLVVDAVAGGNVDIICGAIFPTIGGGVTEVRTLLATGGGLELTHSLQTPATILNPIWKWLAPDVVFSMWADDGANWQSGGNWRTYYSRLMAAHADCDFVQVSRNPSSGEDALCSAQADAQRAWALEANEAFIDINSLFGASFANAAAMEVMGDNVHLNAKGHRLRNQHIWSVLPLGHEQLGAAGPDRLIQAMAEPNSTPAWLFKNQLAVAKGLRIQDYVLTGTDDYWNIDSLSRVMTFKRGAATFFSFSAQDGMSGIYPGYSGMSLGNSSLRWRVFGTGQSLGIVTKTTTYTPLIDDHTMLGNASGGAFSFVLPPANATGMPGRIYVFKKIDSSLNAVTIDGAGSETIDGSLTIRLNSRWERAQIQSNGTAWFRLE